MALYTTNPNESDKLQLELKSEELNNLREIQILEFLQDFAKDYGTKQFNKRFTTALDKALRDKWGTHPIERYDGVTEWNNVYSSMTKLDYRDGYSVRVYFKGHATRWNYDDKKFKMEETSKTLEFYSINDAGHLVTQAEQIERARIESNVKIQTNRKALTRLIAKRNKLVLEVNLFNDSISYAIADTLRIK